MNGAGELAKKLLLAAAALTAATLMATFPVMRWGWPAWAGVAIFTGVTGLSAGARPMWRWQIRWRAGRPSTSVHQSVAALQTKWSEGLERLRRSSLRERGNPVYALPWYLLIGESGVGKTTALTHAGLSTPFDDIKTAVLQPTKNCDWRLFEHSVVIDTAGRYAMPVDPQTDEREWRAFVRLLSRARAKEPLNGAVVAVSAKRLREETADVLESLGKVLRRRINDLMQSMGVKMPIYLLVTQWDSVPGMTGFCGAWPGTAHRRALGALNLDTKTSAETFLTAAFQQLGAALKNTRLWLLRSGGDHVLDEETVGFPESLEKIQAGVAAFLRGAFHENPYQETPWMRGLYFSGAGRDGGKSLFLNEFFGDILPADRWCFVPTRRAVQWKRASWNVGTAAWVALMVLGAALLTHAYLNNLHVLRSVAQEFSHPPLLQGDVVADLLTLDRFDASLLSLERRNSGSWFGQFGLHEGRNVELKFKELLSDQFRRAFLVPFDERLGRSLTEEKFIGSDVAVAQSMAHLLWRIQRIDERVRGNTGQTNQGMPRLPAVSGWTTVSPDIEEKFGRLYVHSLSWCRDGQTIFQERAELQRWLKFILTKKNLSPAWATVWVETQTGAPAVTWADSWGGIPTSAGDPSVSPIFTQRGREALVSLFDALAKSLPDPAFLEGASANVLRWQRTSGMEAWRRYLQAFPKSLQRLTKRDQWRRAGTKMASDENVYFSMLQRASAELEAIAGEEPVPWVLKTRRFFGIKAISVPGVGTLAKMAGESKSDGKEKTEPGEHKVRLLAAAAFADYRAALEKIAPLAGDGGGLADLAAQTFQDDKGSTPFATAYRTLDQLKIHLTQANADAPEIIPLIAGPLEFLWAYACQEAAARLQTQWEESVLAETSGLVGPRALPTLLAPEGPVFKFVKGPAAPYVHWKSPHGYAPKEVFGQSVPFRPPFFAFLNSGAKASNLSLQRRRVSVTATPPTANEDAARQPFSTRLDMVSGEKRQVLENNTRWWARPKKMEFVWDESCGDVLLEIEIGDLRLVKRYEGLFGFFKFVSDFRNGQHTFRPGDFPKDADALARMNVTSIRVNYSITGASDIPAGPQSIPGQAPERIVSCWDN